MARTPLRLDLLLLVLLLLVAATVLFRDLGTASFYGDETIYAQVARESATGDWLPPRFNGQVHLHKPPLRILVTALLFRVMGEGELVARVPDVLLTLALLALVFWQGRRWFGRWAAALAALLLLGAENLLFQHGLRDAVQEATVVVLGAVMLLGWLRHLDEADGAGGRRLLVVALSGAALGLVKNPLGVLFAGLLAALSLAEAWVARRPRVARGGVWLALLAALAGWGGWVVYLNRVTGGYYLRVLYDDLVVRGTRGLDPTHLRSGDFYAQVLAADFGWWLLLALPAARGCWRHLHARGGEAADRARFHLAAWCVALVGLFSLAASKNAWYLYPAYPALALLLASGGAELAAALRRRGQVPPAALGALLAAFLAADLALAWRDAGRDDEVLDADRFAAAYRRLDDAELHVDLESLRAEGDFREWNWYYLSGLPGAHMGSVEEEPLPADRCTFMATPDPEPYRSRGWRWETNIHRIDPREAPLWIVGTCALDLDATGAG